ncbi:phosphoglycolate phosphatase [Marinomonas sp. 2405UD68-3]|uniref:phosphoglycolate phosphatase n=1 Tax=Marinomonas sp. 2405UD68-3 TaxID=3391835 RepID=UPI0039C92488
MRTPAKLDQWFEGWPELVCIDLDGTLVDSVPDLAQAIDYALVNAGAETAGEDRVRTWVGFGAAKLIEQAMQWADVSSDLMEQCYRDFLLHYRDNLTAKTTLYPNAIQLLKTFKRAGVPMALVTNKPSVFIRPILTHFEISDYFSWLIGGDTLEEKKPSPMPLLHCCEALDAEPQNCLMIGDSITDHQAAKEAGFKSMLLTYGYHQGVDLPSLGADFIADDFTELFT